MIGSSSSSIISPQTKYNVFLSFRGEDTRYGFTSHLYESLCKKKILTFIDDDRLIRGDEISPALLSAIEGSKISVIILSQGYASSRWCLEELVKILECKNIYRQIVIPVFYHVDPSHIRNQTGAFGDTFAKLEDRFKEMLEKVQKWRSALRETANLSGFCSNVFRSEAALVKEIVKDILKTLKKVNSPSDNDNLVGIGAQVREIELLLKKDVFTLGIWGIGGVGKTTIAYDIFNKISSQFEGVYFIENVRKELENRGPNHLQQQLLHAILEEEYADIECPITKERLGLMKILIVFDDLTSSKQIEDLIKDPKILGSGSRIIITTRDMQVLKNCKVNHIYEVKGLSHREGLQLFSQYAFQLNHIPEDYMDLSNMVVYYSKGLPLALKVLGSSLLDKGKEVWKSAISKLENALPLDIYKVLKLSYDGLDSEQQDIFLDIACFFKWKNRDIVIKILEACGLEAEYGISVLIDKSLIAISSENTIIMHNLLEEMGKKIACEEKDLGKSSRLWHQKDIKDLLEKNMGAEMTRGICLNMFKIGIIHLNPFAFSKMHNLIFLKVYGDSNNKLHGFQSIEYDFKELKYICWDSYQWKSLPSNFSPKKVVALEMQYSKLEAIWLGVQNLDNLKYIDLSHSTDLLKIPDLSQAPNLEKVILIGCTNLLEITLLSTPGNLNKLVILNLRDCKRLRSLPKSICQLKSLRHLTLSGCSNLKKVPKMPSQIEELYLDGTAIKEFPSSIEHLFSLVKLSFKNCSRFESLPKNICECKSLRYLILTGCSNLKTIPKMPSNVEEVFLNGTAIIELPSPIEHLSRLAKLSFENCSRLEQLPSNFFELKSLRHINLSGCSNFKIVPRMPCNLEELYLDGTAIKELSSSIEHLSSLVNLRLDNCLRIESLPEDISKLESLVYLSLFNCSNFKLVPTLPCHIKELDLFGTAIKELSASSIEHLSSLTVLNLESCSRLESLPSSIEHLSSLESLRLINCSRLKSLPNGICKLNFLKYLSLSGCSILDRLPDNLANLESLKELYADETAIREIPASIMHLNDLQKLSLRRCNVRLPTWSNLNSMEVLDLTDCGITELPNSLGELSSLSNLYLGGNNFEKIPASLINLTRLGVLDVSYCSRLQSLPELPSSLYQLEALSCISLQTFSWSSVLPSYGLNFNKSACFIECSKLDKDALKNSMKFVIQHIRENVILAKQPLGSGWMCFPGSEIPECLNFQSNGSFIELPRGLFNHNFVGMTLCTILAFQDYDYNNLENLLILCKLSLKCEDDNYKQVTSGFFRAWFQRPTCIQSDHMFLGFDSNMFNPAFHEISHNSETIISFHVIALCINHVKQCKVKKCGVHLFYEEEPKEESQESSSNSSNFISDDVMEEQEEPQSKRLKIEDFFKHEYNSRVYNLTLLDSIQVQIHTIALLFWICTNFLKTGPTMDMATTKWNLAGLDGYNLEIATVTYDMQSNSFTLSNLNAFFPKILLDRQWIFPQLSEALLTMMGQTGKSFHHGDIV